MCLARSRSDTRYHKIGELPREFTTTVVGSGFSTLLIVFQIGASASWILLEHVQCENDIVGSEWLTIRPFHALAEDERNCFGIRRDLGAGCKPCLEVPSSR